MKGQQSNQWAPEGRERGEWVCVTIKFMLFKMHLFAEESDWNSVVKECKSLSAKWEKLSIYLGLPPDEIDTIKRDHHDAQDRWNQALLVWIRQCYNTNKYGKPSWRTLLRAIAEENKNLFEKLSQNHLSKPTMMIVLSILS